MTDNTIFEYYSNATPKKIDWLWYPYIAFGKITLLQGDPGGGKSTFILDIAARLSRGENMPDGYEVKKAENVVYQCPEDDISDTIINRLNTAGADISKIAYIIDEEGKLNFEDDRLEKVVKETNARLLILDPLQSFLVQTGDMHNAGKMRAALNKLILIANKYNCAIVIIGHMNKAAANKNLYRALGSIDIVASARSVLMLEKDETHPNIKIVTHIKSNLAPEGENIKFSFEENSKIKYLDVYKKKNESACKRKEKLPQAIDLLINILSFGDKKSTDVIAEMSKNGFSERTIYNAKKKVKVHSYRMNKIWYWKLPK